MLHPQNSNTTDNGAVHDFTIDDDAELGNEKMMNVDIAEPSSAGDQLPNVDEYKASVIGSSVDTRKRFKLYTVVGVSILVIFIIMISAIAGSKKRNENSTQSNNVGGNPNNNADNSSNQTSRFDQAVAIIQENEISDPDLFDVDPNDRTKLTWAPQSKAAFWIANTDPRGIPMVPTTDFINRYVLAVLFYMTDGDNSWKLFGPDFATGWIDDYNFLTGADVCDWNKPYTPEKGGPEIKVGVLCNDNNEIERIWIPNNKLYGRLPDELRLLNSLKEINFYNNYLFGKIPENYIELQSLESIILFQNQLQDTFPTWLDKLPSLQVVNFGKNDIRGTLPDSINNIQRLQVLNCDSCILTGGIETALAGISSLESLELGNNNLNGTLSDPLFASWPNLIELDMNSNQFTGFLPIGLLTRNANLTVVDLHDNNFTGPIIEQEFVFNPRNIASLRVLSLAGNELTGTLGWIEYFPELRHLDLSFNPLSGPIPATIGNLTELRYLFLAMNDKYDAGPIPPEIGLLTNLTDLSFQKSNRNGQIPAEIGALNSLVLLDLQNNSFTGSIPTQLGTLSSINFLLMNDNQLTGAIPDGLITDKLDTLTIQGNKDITSVPTMICTGNDKVRTINVDYNKLNEASKIDCGCCSRCDGSNGADTTCNTFFFSNLDPSSEYNYARVFYQMYEGDSLIPVGNTSLNDMPLYGANIPGWNDNMFGDYNISDIKGELKYLLHNMNTFGGTPNATDPNGGLSNPWEEMQQDFNYTDDYLEKYLDNYLDTLDKYLEMDDKAIQQYLDNEYFDDLYMDDLYNDDTYGAYNEDRPNATLENKPFFDILAPINNQPPHDGN